METVTLCSFNVENLFMRYKIFGYLPSPKPMRRIYSEEELKEAGGFLPSPMWKNSFMLFNKGPWRDLTTFAIKRADRDETIDYPMPDILCMQEVDSMDALRLFNEEYLDNYYPYAILLDSHDPRRIDVAVLSRYKIKSLVTNMYEPYDEGANANQEYLFSRDCLEINFEITNTKSLTVFLNHLKSKFVDPRTPKNKVPEAVEKSNNLRLQQSRKVAEIVNNRFKGSNFNEENFVVAGDFNDTPDSSYLKPLVHDLGMHDVISRLEPKDRWTHWWETKNIVSQIDYILLSPKLADNSPTKPYIERRGISSKRKKFSYLNLRAEENKIPFNFERFSDVSKEFEASDHCPVFFELKL
jgi:endonuclease/exonuclease/phosphatase family metal-dependent hydrolase